MLIHCFGTGFLKTSQVDRSTELGKLCFNPSGAGMNKIRRCFWLRTGLLKTSQVGHYIWFDLKCGQLPIEVGKLFLFDLSGTGMNKWRFWGFELDSSRPRKWVILFKCGQLPIERCICLLPIWRQNEKTTICWFQTGLLKTSQMGHSI